MRERLKHKYALSEQGVNDMIKAVIIVTIANLAFMVPVGLLYLLASDILNGGIPSSKSPMYIGGMVISILLIIITTYFQYNATFLATYVESGVRRRTLAEKLRKIPLSFFGKKDLADLTSTIMGDCAWLETASSHFFPQLFGSMCSTTIVTICLFFFNVKMTLAAVWVLPVAFFVVFGARPISHRLNENAMKYKLECQDGIQEGLETVRDLKSYNATNTYMEGLNKKIQAVAGIRSDQRNVRMPVTADLKSRDRNDNLSRRNLICKRRNRCINILHVSAGRIKNVRSIPGSIREFIRDHLHRHTVQTNG